MMINFANAVDAIRKDASGANGELSLDERVRRASGYVGDLVLKSLEKVERPPNEAVVRAASHLVAVAMCTQHDIDEKEERALRLAVRLTAGGLGTY